MHHTTRDEYRSARQHFFGGCLHLGVLQNLHLHIFQGGCLHSLLGVL